MRYMGKSLTEEQDQLPALSRIANRAQKVLNCRYVASLWAYDMAGRLYCAVDQGLASSPGPGCVNPTSCRAPSESCASINGKISWSNNTVPDTEFCALDRKLFYRWTRRHRCSQSWTSDYHGTQYLRGLQLLPSRRHRYWVISADGIDLNFQSDVPLKNTRVYEFLDIAPDPSKKQPRSRFGRVDRRRDYTQVDNMQQGSTHGHDHDPAQARMECSNGTKVLWVAIGKICNSDY